jgi:hypothetical protein
MYPFRKLPIYRKISSLPSTFRSLFLVISHLLSTLRNLLSSFLDLLATFPILLSGFGNLLATFLNLLAGSHNLRASFPITPRPLKKPVRGLARVIYLDLTNIQDQHSLFQTDPTNNFQVSH